MSAEWGTILVALIIGLSSAGATIYAGWRQREKITADTRKTKAEEKQIAAETADTFAKLAGESAERISKLRKDVMELETRLKENTLMFEAKIKQLRIDFEAELEERDKLIEERDKLLARYLAGIRILTKQLVANEYAPDWQVNNDSEDHLPVL